MQLRAFSVGISTVAACCDVLDFTSNLHPRHTIKYEKSLCRRTRLSVLDLNSTAGHPAKKGRVDYSREVGA
jgi:hypothetical protein